MEDKFGTIDGYIIHHMDGNTDNNNINNLAAFKSHSDHMAFHRFRPTEALLGSTGKWERIVRSRS
jgi:hypothetical protein